MTSYTLPDGTVIDWIFSGKVYGPDSSCSLNFGLTYPYYRINGGEWKLSETIRTAWRADEWCRLCEDLADFLTGI